MTQPLSAALDERHLTAGLPALGSCTLRVTVADRSVTVVVTDGQVTIRDTDDGDPEPDVTFALKRADWESFCQNPPPRGYTTAQAVRATLNGACVHGDGEIWARYAGLVDRLVEALRTDAVGPRPDRNAAPPAPALGRSPIEAGYLNVDVDGETRRIFVESSGSGQVVLCLHTAGADSRQFRHLMEDEGLISRYRFVAFDMPWHGRSDPPDDWSTQTYRLDTRTYAATILAVMDALELERPILLGCSMGGSIGLYMSARYGDRFSGVCALEGGLGNPSRFVPWTNHIGLDHSQFLTSWVGGLIAPNSPTGPRNQTLWGYAQGGPGVYQGDTYFYSRDLPEHTADLPKATCSLWVFSGEYDYSATTEMSREAAERLGGELVVMKGSGHFPMSEDPAVFRGYVVPVLDEITAASKA